MDVEEIDRLLGQGLQLAYSEEVDEEDDGEDSEGYHDWDTWTLKWKRAKLLGVEYSTLTDDDAYWDIPGLGRVYVVEQFGGEGQGDDYYLIFKIVYADTARYFKKPGYYASYDGGYYDGELFEVQPVERLVTFYEAISD